jgi:hypothetical protein
MKRQKSCGPCLGKLVHQLPGVVTFAYGLCFRHMIAHWKGIIKEIYFRGNIKGTSIFQTFFPKKHRLEPQNSSESFRTQKIAKNSKLPKLSENCFELVGKGGWPSISTWINPPSLGRNGIHFIEFPHLMRKFLMNFSPGEPLSLVQELLCFDNSIKLDPLMLSSLDLCVHNIIKGCLLYVVSVDICWCHLFCYF